MPTKRFVRGNKQGEAVDTLYFDGVGTASTTHIVCNVPAGSLVKAFPTSAGTATVYTTQRPIDKIGDSDVDAAQSVISGSTNRQWDAWGSGAVTASTVNQANGPLEGVSIVVASGTWSIEVSRGE